MLRSVNYFLRLPPALENKYVGIDVFNTNPVGKRQSGVGPNPVHHRPQLSQEGNHTETGGKKTVSTIKLFQKSVAELKNESQTQKLEIVFL